MPLRFLIIMALAAIAFNQSACGGKTLNNETTLSYLKVTPATPDVTAGGKINFFVAGVDEDGATLHVSPKWEAHDGRIDSTGVYIAPSYKTIDRVTAYVDAKSATAVISVKSQPEAKTIKIYPEINCLSVGLSQKFTAIGFNESGEEVPVSVTWQCSKGKISQNGEYSAPVHSCAEAIGAKTLSATGVLPLEVKPREVYKIFINPATANVKALGVIKFSAAAYDIYGNIIAGNPGFIYTSLKGKTTNEGYYFAPNLPGTEEVSVSYNYIHDTAQVEITP